MNTITQHHYAPIQAVLPVQRGDVAVENIAFLNAILPIAENGCKWRHLPEKFGKWPTIYVRMRRWADKGVWPRVLESLQSQLNISALSLDSTSMKVPPNGTGALNKTALKPSAKVAVVATQKFT